MILTFAKIAPLIAVGAIGLHSSEAIENRLEGIGKKFRARLDMSVILHSVRLRAISDDGLKIMDQ